MILGRKPAAALVAPLVAAGCGGGGASTSAPVTDAPGDVAHDVVQDIHQ